MLDAARAALAALGGRRGPADDDVGLADLRACRRNPPQHSARMQAASRRHVGITARSVVPQAGRAVDRQRAVERREPVLQPAQAGAALDVRAADAVVGDHDLDARRPRGGSCTRASCGPRVAGDVGQRLGGDEVGGRLDLRRGPLVELDVDLDRQRHAVGEPLHGRPEPAVGEDRGVDAARELAQLGERDGELVGELLDHRHEVGVLHPRAQQPQVERERDELLLGAVVQVALQPPARGVGGLHDAGARDPQVLDAGAQVGLQPLVVERQRRGRRGRVDELRRRVELGVVDDRRHPAPVVLDRRPRAARSRGPGAAPGARARPRTPRGRAASRRSTACGRRRARPAARGSAPPAPCGGRAPRACRRAPPAAGRRGRDRHDRGGDREHEQQHAAGGVSASGPR